MKKFESVIILKPDLTKNEIKEVLEKVEETIQKVAKITNKEEIGIKKLAYEIRKCKEGYYVVHQFEIKQENEDCAESIASIERYFRTQEEIIKFIIVKRD